MKKLLIVVAAILSFAGCELKGGAANKRNVKARDWATNVSGIVTGHYHPRREDDESLYVVQSKLCTWVLSCKDNCKPMVTICPAVKVGVSEKTP